MEGILCLFVLVGGAGGLRVVLSVAEGVVLLRFEVLQGCLFGLNLTQSCPRRV